MKEKVVYKAGPDKPSADQIATARERVDDFLMEAANEANKQSNKPVALELLDLRDEFVIKGPSGKKGSNSSR